MKTFIFTLIAGFAGFNLAAQCTDIETNFIHSTAGATVYFTDSSSTDNGWTIQKRYWDYGDGQIDSVTPNPEHTYAQPGAYNVCLSIIGKLAGDSATALYCNETICHTVMAAATGIAELSSGDWVVYPNPSSGNFRIKGGSGKVKSVTVYNTNGQVLLHTSETDTYIELPNNANNQLYYIRIETDSGHLVKQLRMVQ